MAFDLTEKTVLITGGSRGIGAAIAELFASLNARVIATATSEAGAAGITERLAGFRYPGEGRVLDVSNREMMQTFMARLDSEERMPQILVNNAGITRDNLFIRMKDNEWDDVIETNLSSVYYLSKLALKSMMRARFGRIINISSVIGQTGNAGQANYAAAKAGLGGLSRSLAQEFASRNVTVNVIAPGFIATDMTSVLTAEQQAHLLQVIPLKQIGQPLQIAQMAAFLASDWASYITGQTLHVNGGLWM